MPVYWNLPCGRNVCYSIFALRSVPDDELAPDDSDEVYMEIARQFRFAFSEQLLPKSPRKTSLSSGKIVARCMMKDGSA